MDIISNKKKFNELIKKWTNYINALKFLQLQLAVLLSGFVISFGYYLRGQEPVTLDKSYFIMLIPVVILISYILSIFSDIFKLNIFDSKEKIGFWGFVLPLIIIPFFVSIPAVILLGYITLYNVEPDFKNGLSLYLVLTIGMYQSAKRILSFFLPVSVNGIYSIEELIQEMISEK